VGSRGAMAARRRAASRSDRGGAVSESRPILGLRMRDHSDSNGSSQRRMECLGGIGLGSDAQEAEVLEKHSFGTVVFHRMYLSTVQYFQQRGIVRVTNSSAPGSTGLMEVRRG